MNLKRPLILASSSPRRQFLMREAGFDFTIKKPEDDESFPADLPVKEVARYLAIKKAKSFFSTIHSEIVVTADTVVILGNKILNKPANTSEAMTMLRELSGRTHLVMTGVCIRSAEKEKSFDDTTEVTFKVISDEEIKNYIENYRPLDKAGAYGAQECLPRGTNPCSEDEIEFLRNIKKENLMEDSKNNGTGMVAIEKIVGSYFNVMGLPIHRVYAYFLKLKSVI